MDVEYQLKVEFIERGYLGSLAQEHRELGERVQKLREFIACSSPYIDLEEDEKEAVRIQLEVMEDYLKVLRYRIDKVRERVSQAEMREIKRRIGGLGK
jgi:hypothetical protein